MFSLQYGVNFISTICFIFIIIFERLRKYHEQWLYNIHFSEVKIACVFWSLCTLIVFSSGQMHRGAEYWSKLFQVLRMNRFWLCAVTILSMCNLSSKYKQLLFLFFFPLLEYTYIAIIQFIIETSNFFSRKNASKNCRSKNIVLWTTITHWSWTVLKETFLPKL